MIPPRAIVILAALVAAFLLAALGKCKAHDQFMEWKQPETGMPCCSGHPSVGDCYATEARFVDGHWLAKRREDGRWLTIPDSAVLKDFVLPSAFLCNPKPFGPDDMRVFCFRPPFMGI